MVATNPPPVSPLRQLAALARPASHPEDRRALAALFLRQIPGMMLGNLLVGLVTAWLVDTRQESDHIWLWFAALALMVGVRHTLALHHKRHLNTLDADGLGHMELQHSLLAVNTGLLWGAMPWLGYSGGDPYVDFYIAAVLAGMTGGALMPLSALPFAFPFYAAAALLPYSLRIIGGNEVYLAGGLTMLFYFFILTLYHHNAHQTLAEAIRLRRENARLVADLRAEKHVAEEAARVKSLFLAGVSHDLKHPLHSLGLYLGYLKSLPGDTVAQGLSQALPGMEQSLAGMRGQLARLLDLSRLEEGGVRPVLETQVLEDVFQRCGAQFTEAAAGKGITLRFRPGTHILRTDPAMLQSILDNLVANAVRCTERGGVLVAARRGREGLAIEVWDSGPGIAAERIPLLFQAYRRFDDTAAGEAGHGLGLALVGKQCQLLGYRVEVRSRPGRGSLFRVILPAPTL